MGAGLLLTASGLPDTTGAAARDGTYRGKSSQGGAIRFKVKDARVTSFRFRYRLRCGDRRSWRRGEVFRAMRISHRGRFNVGDNAALRLSGRLRGGARAKGSFRVHLRLGGRKCRSATVHWSARRR